MAPCMQAHGHPRRGRLPMCTPIMPTSSSKPGTPSSPLRAATAVTAKPGWLQHYGTSVCEAVKAEAAAMNVYCAAALDQAGGAPGHMDAAMAQHHPPRCPTNGHAVDKHHAGSQLGRSVELIPLPCLTGFLHGCTCAPVERVALNPHPLTGEPATPAASSGREAQARSASKPPANIWVLLGSALLTQSATC